MPREVPFIMISGTVSLGSWPCVELFMTGSIFEAPDALSLAESQLHFHFGNNWAANKAGNTPLQLNYAKEQGGRLVIVDPVARTRPLPPSPMSGCPSCPAPDTAFCLGMMYHQVENGLQNQEFLGYRTAWGSTPSICPRAPTPRRTSRTTCLGHLRRRAEDAGMGRGYLRCTCGHYAPSRRGDR